MASAEIEKIINAISEIGGEDLGRKARPILESLSVTESASNDCLSDLTQVIDLAKKFEVSLPVTSYSFDFLNQAAVLIASAGNYLGFTTNTEAGSTYLITGIYWVTSTGETGCYIIKIEDYAPPTPPEPHDSLESLFTDIADAIREKSGTSDPLIADQFPTYIRNLL